MAGTAEPIKAACRRGEAHALLDLWARRPAGDQASASPATRRGLGRRGAKSIPLLGPPGSAPGTRIALSSPQPDPQRPKLPTPKVNQQHLHDTSGHAREIESTTRVEMTRVLHSFRALLLHIMRRCSVSPRYPPSQCRWALKNAPGYAINYW
jgi:hypothetical protein